MAQQADILSNTLGGFAIIFVAISVCYHMWLDVHKRASTQCSISARSGHDRAVWRNKRTAQEKERRELCWEGVHLKERSPGGKCRLMLENYRDLQQQRDVVGACKRKKKNKSNPGRAALNTSYHKYLSRGDSTLKKVWSCYVRKQKLFMHGNNLENKDLQ